jgi:hypothetical protein
MKAVITREKHSDKQTLGTLILRDDEGNMDVTNSKDTLQKLLKVAPNGFELDIQKKAIKKKNA